MRARPAVVGGFILGAFALGVAAILFFGGEQLFATTSHVVLFFNEFIGGLDVGAPVTFRGVRVGSVENTAIRFSTKTMTARIPVVLGIQSERITWEDTKLGVGDFERLVQAGLRAQLSLQSLVTGQLRVDLEFRPGTPAHFVGTISGVPEIPTVPSELGQFRNQLANLPLRELADSAQRALASFERLSDHLDAKLDPLADSAHRALEAATQTLQKTDEAMGRVQAEASSALHDLDSLLVDAQRQLDARSSDLGRTLTAADHAARQAETLLNSLNSLAEPRAQFRSNLEATARDLAATASSLRSFSNTIERNPSALLMSR